MKTDGGPLPIESKYSLDIGKRETRVLEKFCRKYGCREAIVITKNEEKTTGLAQAGVKLMPLWKWLLE